MNMKKIIKNNMMVINEITKVLDKSFCGKKEERWLFTDWAFGMSSFKIYDSFETFNLITSRTINSGGITNWFNIDNIKREIEEYAKSHPNIKIKGLKETLGDIHSMGFSYTDKTKKKDIEINSLSDRNIKIID